MSTAMQSFRELDDLVLHLKGLVLVRGVREEREVDLGHGRMVVPRDGPSGARRAVPCGAGGRDPLA